jgi:hypothetical protein
MSYEYVNFMVQFSCPHPHIAQKLMRTFGRRFMDEARVRQAWVT